MADDETGGTSRLPGQSGSTSGPVVDTSGSVMVRLTAAQAEALTDAVPGELADDWPEDWPARGDALEAITAALNGETGPPDGCLHCLGYAVDVAASRCSGHLR